MQWAMQQRRQTKRRCGADAAARAFRMIFTFSHVGATRWTLEILHVNLEMVATQYI